MNKVRYLTIAQSVVLRPDYTTAPLQFLHARAGMLLFGLGRSNYSLRALVVIRAFGTTSSRTKAR